LKLSSQPLNNGLTPTDGVLALDEGLANLPVEFDKLSVDTELRDRLVQAGLATAATGRWEAKRDEFIHAFSGIQKRLSGPTSVPLAEHEALKQTFAAAQAIIEEKNAQIDDLKELTEKLKKCNDQAEVIAVMREHSSDEDEFRRITTEFKRLARAIPQPALEAVYYHCRE
jgi:hypothetical protein